MCANANPDTNSSDNRQNYPGAAPPRSHSYYYSSHMSQTYPPTTRDVYHSSTPQNNSQNYYDYPFCPEISRYERVKKIGQGTFGEVFYAKCKRTQNSVALKKVRMENEKEGFPMTALREIRILQSLNHENVVKLIEICRSIPSQFNRDKGSIYMVFEFCEHDLAGLLICKELNFSLSEIKYLMQQLFKSLYYIHQNNILHRDMKTSNILITKEGRLKLGDFGLARCTVNSRGNQYGKYTNKVVTLWYRAPELLLGDKNYTAAVDMWGAGCIMAEMWIRSPILQGHSDIHQLKMITNLCGGITPKVWQDVESLESYSSYAVQIAGGKRRIYDRLRGKINDIPSLDLIDRLLTLDPKNRIFSSIVLGHDFFSSDPQPYSCERTLSSLPDNCFEMTVSPRHRGAMVNPNMRPPLPQTGVNISMGDRTY